uniref:NADH-ubiquinone oxidoreductase chain 4L n=1 Tax=Bragasellus peltatus TaxID=1282048 RepID=A0A485M8Q5_9CRUS|nr:NADH dehydrogenase subunit 4l [Bragasellus peltatus]
MVGVLSFVWNNNHILASLISLEYMALILFLTINITIPMSESIFMSLIYLTISVCEGALGLGILVNCARARGSDMMNNISLNMW